MAPWKRQPWDYSCTYGYKRLNVQVTALTREELVLFLKGYKHGLYILNTYRLTAEDVDTEPSMGQNLGYGLMGSCIR